MAITFSINLNVTPLTDNTVAFANAAAWNNYFNDLSANATLDPIDVTSYTPSPYDEDLTPDQITIDGTVFTVPNMAMWNSLLASYQTLSDSYSTLRAELYAAGLIDAP